MFCRHRCHVFLFPDNRLYLVVCPLNELENNFSVGYVYCCLAQLFFECLIVQNVKVLQQKQTCRLIIRIKGHDASQLVEGLATHFFRMHYQTCQFHSLFLIIVFLQVIQSNSLNSVFVIFLCYYLLVRNQTIA